MLAPLSVAEAQLLDPPEGKVHWRLEAASGPPLSDVTQIIAAEELAEPKWAPGMRYIGVTRKNRRGLWVIRLTDGKVLRISPAYGSGRDYAFSFDGTKIIFNIREPKAMAALHEGPPHWTFMIVDLDKEKIDYRGPVEKGFLSLSWFRPTEFQTVVRHDKTLEVRHYISSDRVPAFEKGRMQRWGVVGVTERAGSLWKMRADHTRRGYRFELPPHATEGMGPRAEAAQDGPHVAWPDLLNPNLSHNERVIAVQSEEGRAYLVGTATDLVVDLGEGQNVRWGWWYDKAVFERVQTAGDEVVSSEIILADLKKLKSYNLTQTPGAIERYPDLSLNQKWVTYVTPEGLFVGRVPSLEGKK